MKKLTLVAVAMAALAAPSLAGAQSAKSGGSVNYKSSYLAAQGVGFGQVTPGVDQEIALSNTGSRGYIGVEFNARSVVTFTSSGTLTQTLDANGGAVAAAAATVLPTYYCAVVDDNGSQSGPGTSTTYITGTSNTSCFTGNTTTLDLVSNRKTARWIVVGGKIPAASTADLPAGTYSGSVTVSIAKSST